MLSKKIEAPGSFASRVQSIECKLISFDVRHPNALNLHERLCSIIWYITMSTTWPNFPGILRGRAHVGVGMAGAAFNHRPALLNSGYITGCQSESRQTPLKYGSERKISGTFVFQLTLLFTFPLQYKFKLQCYNIMYQRSVCGLTDVFHFMYFSLTSLFLRLFGILVEFGAYRRNCF